MKKIIIWLIGIIVVVGGVYLLESDRGTKVAESGPIKVGFIGPLTGDTSSLGEVSKSAVELAVKEINDKGGIRGQQVQMIYEDGQCTPTYAINAAQKLINTDKVSAIIGGLCSSETSAFVASAMKEKVPTIAYCSSAPSLSSSGKYFFRTYPSDSYQGKFAAEYAYQSGARRVAILYHISDWGTGIKDVFTKRFVELGGEVVVSEGASQETRDYRTQLSKINDVRADYLYMSMYVEGSLAAVDQAVKLGVKSKILGTDTWSDPKFVDQVNRGVSVTYVGSTGVSNDEFKKKILAKTGLRDLPICAGQAYDAVTVLANAVEKVGTNPDKLQGAIRAENFQGVSGPIAFDQNGDVTSAQYVVKRIENGKIVDVK